MPEDFAKAVEDGRKLGKRIYLGKDRAVAPPKPLPAMEKSPHIYLPSGPMVYPVISDPRIVDNPDIPSYQPHVHGRLDRPALIPLQMNAINLDVDCHGDTDFVQVSGTWRVHCVMGIRSCNCPIAVPMGDQIDGGTSISIKLHWSQKSSYNDGQLTLTVPFSFPEFVNPAIRKIARKEKIHLNVNSGIATGIVQATSHPFKELKSETGEIGFLYEANVLTWFETDLSLSYSVSSSNIFGGALFSLHRYMIQIKGICSICIFSPEVSMVFRKEVIFVVDISGSMRGKSLESSKHAINTALSNLSQEDSFNIILFGDETFLFCTSMVLASEEAVERASEG
ncbi:hypothetical protein F3Y22_tig00116975pilonHSYRG00038 [Hibiscus syriacus]|uniref:VWFA domain-containing protein n=1 Tax=Hibiscus syriacus TaxID=106335 RepID=A0A6A2XV67_HIBSY|nr:hypothetical protein F3Y22_tig00116975pilonHSYRG00038 [Hibiscus syriacus]